ncbi:hypothetical protein OIU77_029501 [Salix suchowensis]|uniref:Uncharacterized protein n=1 Tax=Salix suchowensis TaxID=1278906 RepID=A0ABQ9B8T4_9ROSI|nr:hypothetical protein OIU77_029501 [Salix suchowensis]
MPNVPSVLMLQTRTSPRSLEEGCRREIGYFAVILLGLYIIYYSPGMGTAPWIYSLKTLTVAGAFLLFAGISFLALIAIFFLVPETKGLQFEEVEKMLKSGFRPKLFSKNTKGADSV